MIINDYCYVCMYVYFYANLLRCEILVSQSGIEPALCTESMTSSPLNHQQSPQCLNFCS